jgi:luciferase family oxidoreductase group 1
MRLGILDFCRIHKGIAPYESLFESVQLAQEADALGYSRFWLAEHHELNYAHHAPDILATLIAGSTERIRVGVAGVLIKLHSPMRVAKAFRLMEAFFPGRIDLGVGGGEAEPPVVEAMRDGAQPIAEVRAEYDQRLLRLLSLIRGESPLAFNPLGTPAPPFWVLGLSRPNSARLAAEKGTCFGFSLAHVQSRDNPSITAIYLDEFRPNAHLAQPELVVAVSGLCAETEEEAWRLAKPMLEGMDLNLAVVGNPEQCREKLEAIAHRYRTQEIIFQDVAPDSASRMNCFRLLASALKLGAEPAKATQKVG